jgi:hypothetical protein
MPTVTAVLVGTSALRLRSRMRLPRTRMAETTVTIVGKHGRTPPAHDSTRAPSGDSVTTE